MARKLVILEDDERRTVAMRAALVDCIDDVEARFFDNAPAMIAGLATAWPNVAVVVLDHDLGPNRGPADEPFDPGTGRDVADWMAAREPICPVLIHTTNTVARPGMERVLGESGWPYACVSPYGDLEWIEEVWIKEVQRLLGGAGGTGHCCALS